jgi:small-conductance mechanosensitive channel
LKNTRNIGMIESVKELISQLITEWGWAIALAILAIAMKDSLSKFWLGVQFLWGNDFNVDDIVYINGNKKARIVRQNVWKTTFYLYEHDRKFIIPNDRIWTLNIEKELPKETIRHNDI